MGINIKFQKAFTIVELIIVITVIGIIATLTVLGYGAIRQNATVISLKSDLTNAADTLRSDQANSGNDSFPDTLAAASNGDGVKASNGTNYQYAVSNTADSKTFCLTATSGTQNYSINQEGLISFGVCPVLYFDAGLPTSYSGTGTTVNDLSGNGITGTLVNGVGYDSANSGSFVFDGVSAKLLTDYQTVSNEMTWSACFYSTGTLNSLNMFMGKGMPYFSFQNGNRVLFSNYIAGVQRSVYSSPTLSINNWYCTTFTTQYDGANTTMSTYINGDLAGSGTWPGAQSPYGYGFTVGDGRPVGWYPFKGKVSDVKIFNRNFSADEVKQQFDSIRADYGL